jgi:hypothetical protein
MREPFVPRARGEGYDAREAADGLNRGADALDRASDFRAPFGEVSGAGTHVFAENDDSWWALLTDKEGGYAAYGGCGATPTTEVRYAWKRTTPRPTGAASDADPPLSGTTEALWAREVNGLPAKVGKTVRMWLGAGGEHCDFSVTGTDAEDVVGGASDCPVWSCCLEAGVVCGPNPDDPGSDAWLSLACPPWTFYDPDSGCGGDPNCGFWSCDGGETPCQSVEDLCGCTDFETAAGCYPFYGDVDLQSTGISLACLFGCRDGQLTVRKACLNIVPGGPFGHRLALLAKGDGRELKSPTDGDPP